MHITKLQQAIATSQHIWLLTTKLIKKTANMTTYKAVKDQICQHSIGLFCQLQKHGTFHMSKSRCVTCLVLVNINFPYFMVYEYNIFMTCASWCAEFIGDKNGKSTVRNIFGSCTDVFTCLWHFPKKCHLKTFPIWRWAVAVVTTTIRYRFDCSSTALRPLDDLRYGQKPTWVWAACYTAGLNK